MTYYHIYTIENNCKVLATVYDLDTAESLKAFYTAEGIQCYIDVLSLPSSDLNL